MTAENNELKAENAKLRNELDQWERLTANIELPEYPIAEFQPKDLERENAKLRKLGKKYELVIVDYRSEVAKLRELVRDMWRFTGAACKKYPRLFDPAAQGGQTVQLNAIDAFEQRMRELGITGVD